MKEIKFSFEDKVNPIQGKKGAVFSGDKNISRIIVLDDSGKFYFNPVKIGDIMNKFNIMLGSKEGLGITTDGNFFIRKD